MKLKKLTIFILMALTAITFAACSPADNGFDTTVAREYWSLEYAFETVGQSLHHKRLKKIEVNKDGAVLAIHNYENRTREDFHYSSEGRLEYSETIWLNRFHEYFSPDEQPICKPLYKTVYVYEEDKIVRGEVFTTTGIPTQSCDEYEYTEEGALKTVKRYEKGKLDRTYHYNGKAFPEALETEGDTYQLTYDESGNLTSLVSITTTDPRVISANVKYDNGLPSEITIQRNEENKVLDTKIIIKRDGKGNDTEWDIVEGYDHFLIYHEFDNEGRIVMRSSMAYPKRNETIYKFSYDEQGRLTECECVPPEGKSGPDAKYVITGYNEQGYAEGIDLVRDGETQHLIKYEFDGFGRPIKRIRTWGNIDERIYEYHPNGELKSIKDFVDGVCKSETLIAENGNYISYRYTVNGQQGNYEVLRRYISSATFYGFSRHNHDGEAEAFMIRKSDTYPDKIVIYEYDEYYNLINIKEIPN